MMNLNNTTKKIVISLILFCFVLPIVTFAANTCDDWKDSACTSLVCCGNGEDKCNFEDLFCLVNKIIDFILFKFVPPLAILWFVFGGVTMMTANGDPAKIESGKKMITYGVLGVFIVYAAWAIVYSFVNYLTDGNPWPLNFFENPSS